MSVAAMLTLGVISLLMGADVGVSSAARKDLAERIMPGA